MIDQGSAGGFSVGIVGFWFRDRKGAVGNFRLQCNVVKIASLMAQSCFADNG